MDHVERTRCERTTMHASVRRERVERLQTKGGVPRRGRGKGRARHADGEGASQGNYPEPQYEPQEEMKEQVEGDDEYHEVGDDEQQ